jgi:hypothetical protein
VTYMGLVGNSLGDLENMLGPELGIGVAGGTVSGWGAVSGWGTVSGSGTMGVG